MRERERERDKITISRHLYKCQVSLNPSVSFSAEGQFLSLVPPACSVAVLDDNDQAPPCPIYAVCVCMC